VRGDAAGGAEEWGGDDRWEEEGQGKDGWEEEEEEEWGAWGDELGVVGKPGGKED
jgi:hypothetical protein